MNRATRDKFVSGTNQQDLTTGNATWETPPLIYQQLNEDFGPFNVDLTADEQRHLCPIWFGPGGHRFGLHAHHALQAPWIEYGMRGYSNPPYGHFVKQLLPKAKMEAERGFTSVLLLPLRITKAFKAHVLVGAADLIFLDRRLTFFEDGVPRCSRDKKGKLKADPALFDSILVRYSPDAGSSPRLAIWKVPKHVTSEDLERAEQRMREAA